MNYGLIGLIKKHEIFNKMKISLTIILLFFCLSFLHSQEVSLPSKFCTMRNARISTGIGFEGGYNLFNGTPPSLKNVIDSSSFSSYSLSFDLYAPNSFLGFMTEANYGNWELTLNDSRNTEYFLIRTLEIPLYVKLRFGKIENSHRLWLVVGASYIAPLSVYRTYNNLQTDRNMNQVNGVKVLTGMFGYEQYFGERKDFKAKNPKGTYDRMRFVLFLRYSYILDSRLNSKYYQSSNITSILNNYDGFNFKDMSVSGGIKYFIRLGIFK